MIDRRVLYWSGAAAIPWLWVLEILNHWMQRTWQARILGGGSTRFSWISIAATYFGVLALGAVATHVAFFLRRPHNERIIVSAFRLLPHLLLCGVLLATSVLLASPEIAGTLNEFRLDFLGSLLFYVAGVWSLVAVFENLSGRSAPQEGR